MINVLFRCKNVLISMITTTTTTTTTTSTTTTTTSYVLIAYLMSAFFDFDLLS